MTSPVDQSGPLELEDSSPRYDVFLSYTRADEDVVVRMVRRLRESGYEPWFDLESINAGDSWVSEIDSGLRNSDIFLVLIGHGERAGWVVEELDAAVDRAISDQAEGPRILPVLLPGAPEHNGGVDRREWPSWLRTRQWVDLRSGPGDDEAWADLIDALSETPSGDPVEIECPYPGLLAFEEGESKYFFGRQRELDDLSRRIRRSRFLAVTGASGTGKSSLVRAGLVPDLRASPPTRQHAHVVVMRPGDDAYAWLRAALVAAGVCDGADADRFGRPGPAMRQLAISLATAGELILVVDQFEELFQQPTAGRSEFIDLLPRLCQQNGPARVIITLRADFLGRAAEHQELASLLSSNQYVLSPLQGESLRQAIEVPAHRVGLEFHAGLVERIMGDVNAEPGSLPLLAHLLERLFERRRRNRLTLPAYEELGGVATTLTQTADAVINSLSPADQVIARRILLRLSLPGDGTEDVRAPARLIDLLSGDDEEDAVRSVIRHLVDGRLIVTDAHPDGGDVTIDVIHESLLRSWPRLRTWIRDRRGDLRLHRAIALDTRAWQENDEDPSYLYRGNQLVQATALREGDDGLLNIAEVRFVNEAELAEEARRAAREQAQREAVERTAQIRRRTRMIVATALVALLVAGLAVTAEILRREAERNERAARTAELAAAALARVDNQRDLALLLGAEAFVRSPTTNSTSALVEVLARESLPTPLLQGLDSTITDFDLNREGTELVVAEADGDLQVVTLDEDGWAGGEAFTWREHGAGRGTYVAWLTDEQFVSAGATGRVLVHDVTGAVPIDVGRHLVQPVALDVQDQIAVVAYEDGTILAWRTDDGHTVADWHLPDVTAFVIGPDRRTVVAAAGRQVYSLDLIETGQPAELVIETLSEVTALAVDNSSNSLAIGESSGRVEQLYLDDRTRRGVPIRTSFGSIAALSYDPTGQELVAGTDRRPRVLRWNADTGEPVGNPLWRRPTGEDLARLQERFLAAESIVGIGHLDRGAIFSGAGRSIVRWEPQTGTGLVARRWRLDNISGLAWVHGEPVTADESEVVLASNGAGTRLVEADGVGNLAVTGPAGPALTERLGWPVVAAAVGNSGQIVAVGGGDGEVAVHDGQTWYYWSADGTITALAVDDQGRRIAVARSAERPTLSLLTIDGDELVASAPLEPAHRGTIDSLSFHPSEQALVSGGDDRTIAVWDLADDNRRSSPPVAHADRVHGLVFAVDGTRLVSESEDGTIQLWEWDDGSLATLGQPVDVGVTATPIVAADDGVLVSRERWIEHWQLSDAHLLAAACRYAGRPLTSDERQQFSVETAQACTP